MFSGCRQFHRRLLRITLNTLNVPSTSKLLPATAAYLQQTQPYASSTKKRRKFVEEIVFKKVKSNKQTIEVYSDMTAMELSKALNVNANELTDFLIDLNPKLLDLVAEDKPIGQEYVLKAVAGYGCKPRIMSRPSNTNDIKQIDDVEPQPPASENELVKRPPVVTIMGHVDHGKTTLLDTLRKSNITASEFGGITQHIGAFSVELKGRHVTFLDTPGHAAFAQMRARGAQGSDLVVLVVAADDGVKEQTEQSIKFARTANVPIVVAINKCDKPQADPMRSMRSLLQHEIVPESLGGDVQCVQISALQGTNIDALTEAILTQADIMNLRATPKGRVEATVIEATTAHGIGKVTTLVVSRGTLKKGAVLVGGTTWCKVKTMSDEHGKELKSAGPGMPVRIAGWREELPNPGEVVIETETIERATKAAAYRQSKQMETKAEKDWQEIEEKREAERKIYKENRAKLMKAGIRYSSTVRRVVHRENRLRKDTGDDDKPKMRIILRTDAEGTLEAILTVIESYDCTEECDLQIVDFDVGAPTERDVELAKETGAQIYLFNVEAPKLVRSEAEQQGVQLLYYNVIYRLVEALKDELSARLPMGTERELIGEGHVLKEFLISDRGRKKQPIAGTLVDWGNFERESIFKFVRGSQVIYEGQIESMKHEKELVTNASTNTEVGIALVDKSIRFKEDDQVEVYKEKQVSQRTSWKPPGF